MSNILPKIGPTFSNVRKNYINSSSFANAKVQKMFHNIKFRLQSDKIIWIFFFEAATNRKSSNELNTILTICNLFAFYNLSIEFGYKDFEDQIQSFNENYRIQNGDIKSITNFKSLNQSFFDQFISLILFLMIYPMNSMNYQVH